MYPSPVSMLNIPRLFVKSKEKIYNCNDIDELDTIIYEYIDGGYSINEFVNKRGFILKEFFDYNNIEPFKADGIVMRKLL